MRLLTDYDRKGNLGVNPRECEDDVAVFISGRQSSGINKEYSRIGNARSQLLQQQQQQQEERKKEHEHRTHSSLCHTMKRL